VWFLGKFDDGDDLRKYRLESPVMYTDHDDFGRQPWKNQAALPMDGNISEDMLVDCDSEIVLYELH